MMNWIFPKVLLCIIGSSLAFRHVRASCVAGTYGLHCQYNCSENCYLHTCGISQGKDIPECYQGCQEKHTGVFCQELCPSLCLECNQKDGTCLKCTSGYFGATCENMCPEHCVNRTCSVNGSCDQGHRLSMLSGYNYGGSCLQKAESEDNCICCENFHRGKSCIQCDHCRTHYIPNPIQCEYECETGYYGNMCDNKCPITCAPGNNDKPLCKITQGGTLKCLNGCNRGYTGQQCDSHCGVNCANGICYQENGLCIHCVANKYGDMCDQPCNDGCVDSCFRNGTCKGGCKDNFLGETCDNRCPDTCVSINESTPVCEVAESGKLKCLSGCTSGFYGPSCNVKCSENCVESKCNQEDGTCSAGCRDGFYGASCAMPCGNNCQKSKCETNGNGTYICSLGCLDGYKGNHCNRSCPLNCMKCQQISDGEMCTKCTEGYFLEEGLDKGRTGHKCKLITREYVNHTPIREISVSPVIKAIIAAIMVIAAISIITCLLILYRKRKNGSYQVYEIERANDIDSKDDIERSRLQDMPKIKTNGDNIDSKENEREEAHNFLTLSITDYDNGIW